MASAVLKTEYEVPKQCQTTKMKYTVKYGTYARFKLTYNVLSI